MQFTSKSSHESDVFFAYAPVRVRAGAITVESPVKSRVIIADDHRMVCEQIGRLVAPLVDVVAVVHTGAALLMAARQVDHDPIISDIAMPDIDGIAVLRLLRAAGVMNRFLCLSMHSSPAMVATALHAGAAGYVAKVSAGEELVRAVTTVLAGNRYVTAELAIKAISVDAPKLLTPRQSEIAHLTCKGLRTKEVAAAMGLSPRTVESHLYTLRQIFHVHSRVALAWQLASTGFGGLLPRASTSSITRFLSEADGERCVSEAP